MCHLVLTVKLILSQEEGNKFTVILIQFSLQEKKPSKPKKLQASLSANAATMTTQGTSSSGGDLNGKSCTLVPAAFSVPVCQSKRESCGMSCN